MKYPILQRRRVSFCFIFICIQDECLEICSSRFLASATRMSHRFADIQVKKMQEAVKQQEDAARDMLQLQAAQNELKRNFEEKQKQEAAAAGSQAPLAQQ